MKIWNYIIGAITMMLFLQFSGIGTPMGSMFSGLLGVEFDSDGNLNRSDITSGNFSEFEFDFGSGSGSSAGWLSLIAAGTVLAGLIVSGRSDIALKASFATAILGLFISSLYFAVTYGLEVGISGWATALLGIIFIPYTVGYLIAIVEFVAGGTSD